jgi:hypothetical protein
VSGRLPLYRRDGTVAAYALVDTEVLPLVERRRWHQRPAGYVAAHATTPLGTPTTITLHRLIMSAPVGMDVDHINGDPLDNRRCNLRVCTHAENMKNHRGQKGEMRGVRRMKNRWHARIMVDRVDHHLGSFKTVEEAIAARRAAEVRLRGEFAPVGVA